MDLEHFKVSGGLVFLCTPFISKERDQSYSACHLIDSNTALTEMTDSNRFVLLKEKMEIEQFENLPIIMQKEIILKTLR